jgi:hypothetical protein
MDEKTEKYLAQLLEGYERNMEPLQQGINQLETQLEGARKQKEEMETGIVDLKELLGLEDEVEEETAE